MMIGTLSKLYVCTVVQELPGGFSRGGKLGPVNDTHIQFTFHFGLILLSLETTRVLTLHSLRHGEMVDSRCPN